MKNWLIGMGRVGIVCAGVLVLIGAGLGLGHAIMTYGWWAGGPLLAVLVMVYGFSLSPEFDT